MSDAAYMKLVLSGTAFDKSYVTAMVDDHKQDVAASEKESENAQDPAVRNSAANTLPTLRKHLSMMEKIQHEMSTR